MQPVAKYFIFPLTLFLILVSKPNCYAATLELMADSTKVPISYTIKADEVVLLAGMKLTLQYPEQLLQLTGSKKGKAFSSFLHVVNDKIPGKLIIVMASATGVTGKNLDIFTLNFTPLSPKIETNPIQLKQCQLMNENLKEIPCNLPQP